MTFDIGLRDFPRLSQGMEGANPSTFAGGESGRESGESHEGAHSPGPPPPLSSWQPLRHYTHGEVASANSAREELIPLSLHKAKRLLPAVGGGEWPNNQSQALSLH